MKTFIKIVDSNGRFVNKFAQEIIDVLEKWFVYIEDKSQLLIEDSLPSIIVNDLIEFIDDDLICNESWRMPQQFGALPEFSRLSSSARRGMIEDLINVIRYQRSHAKEYFKEI